MLKDQYSNDVMEQGQQLPSQKFFSRATARRRLVCALIFLTIAAGFVLGWLMGRYHFSPWPFVCGFKQLYGLPCPTCGYTTSVVAFAQGKIIQAFYIQPAAGFFCCLAVIIAFFTFLTAVFGIYSPVLERRLASVKLRYVLGVILLVFAAGWAVTMARALAEKAGY